MKFSRKFWTSVSRFSNGHFTYPRWIVTQVPHAFQQKLSAEKTPTLCNALPAFEAMINKWQQMQLDNPETADIIQKGLDKLGSYQDRLERVPAYILAMS